MLPWLAAMLLAMSTGVAGAQDPAKQDAKETKATAPPGANAENTSAGSSAGETSTPNSTTTEKKKPKKGGTTDEIGSGKGGGGAWSGTESGSRRVRQGSNLRQTRIVRMGRWCEITETRFDNYEIRSQRRTAGSNN